MSDSFAELRHNEIETVVDMKTNSNRNIFKLMRERQY